MIETFDSEWKWRKGMVFPWDIKAETCEYLKPRRRKSIGREPLTAEGQREFIKGAVREEAGAEALTSNNR